MVLDVPKEEQPPKEIPEAERIIPLRLHNPKDTRPQPKPVVSDAANIASFWANTKWWFYQPGYADGTRTVNAAEIVIDANLNVPLLEMLSNQTDADSCTQAVRNDLHGNLVVHPATATTPYPWLQFFVSGTQYWTDNCNPSLDHEIPISGQWNWLAKPLDQYGTRFEFMNANYPVGKWFRDFVVQRIR